MTSISISTQQAHSIFCVSSTSRGHALTDARDGSIAARLSRHFRALGLRYLIVSRILENTVYFSLINFLQLNGISCKTLLTNMGLVDFTPKKKEVIEDILLQKKSALSNVDIPVERLEDYVLASGERAPLYSINLLGHEAAVADKLLSQCEVVYLLESTEFPPECVFQRPRPPSFYSQLKQTNTFLVGMARRSDRIKIIEPPLIHGNWAEFSYDGIHFTADGHARVFAKIMEAISGEQGI